MRKKITILLSTLSLSTFAQVGINTENPSATLHIQAQESGKGFKLVDGNEGNGKVLMSDEAGNATWKNLFSGDEVIGTFSWDNTQAFDKTKWNSVANLTLAKGTYMVYYRIHLINRSTTNYSRVFVGKENLVNYNGANNSRTIPIVGTNNFYANAGKDLEIALSFIYTAKEKETLYLNLQSDNKDVRRSEFTKNNGAILENEPLWLGVSLYENYFYAVKID